MKTPCPLCQKNVEKEGNKYHPFCSERCKMIDLGHWAEGAYRIPGDEERKESEDSEAPNQEGE